MIYSYIILFTLKFITIIFLLFLFYNYIKKIIFKFSPVIASKTKLINNYPFSEVVGTIELLFTAIFHVLFCISLFLIFHIDLTMQFKIFSIYDCFYGAFIGIGTVGISILLCTAGMKILEIIQKNKVPNTLSGWMKVSNAGWIRHHKHTITVLPIVFALLIITLQIGSEETIFRGLLINMFLPYGKPIALLISTTLFIFMQTFHMPSLASKMFPVIGAIVMGVTHGVLYAASPSIIPLIISHLTFFIFTLL